MRFLQLGIVLFVIINCQAQKASDKVALAKTFDKIISAKFKAGEPGCAALVVHKGQIIYKKAFGMADLENNIAMRPEMVFRIGSITKQFTAIAILQLMEQGKLNLQDEITRFIPDYPTTGKKITIEHLLTHTSGIKSYTGMKEFDDSFQHKDLKPMEIVDFFKNQPMEFEPGTKWNYNNSGYVLLGVIIEKVSGKSYEDYIEQTIFKPLGMNSSMYGSNSEIIKNRAVGYQPAKAGVENASYLSMSLPYSAGSLMSTVEDLYKWNQAVHSYKLVKKETLEKAFTGYKLAGGRDTYYGYGWSIGELDKHRVIEHGGGINGYLTDGLYIPDEELFIALFSNCTCHPADETAQKMAAAFMGLPIERKAIPADSISLKKYIGVYEDPDGETRVITAKGNQLFSQRSSGSIFKIFPYEEDKFFFEGSPSLLQFIKADGKVTGLNMKSGLSPATWWKKVDKPMPTAKKEIMVSEAILKSYAGEYELSSQFSINITVEDGKLMAQATSQPKFELFAENESRFFLKVVDAQIDFVKDSNGKVTHLVLHQGGQDMEGKKVK